MNSISITDQDVHLWHKVPLFPALVTVATTIPELRLTGASDEFISTLTPLTTGMAGEIGAGYFVMYFSPDITYGCISHECLHIVNMILDYVGQDPDRGNDECDAYLLGWLVDFVCDELKLNRKGE